MQTVSPPWADAIAAFSAAQRVASKSPETIRLRQDQLSLLARHTTAGPWEVTGEDLYAWLASGSWGQERRRSIRTTLRMFYGWAVAVGKLEDNPADVLPKIRAMAPNPRPTPDAAFRRAQLAADQRTSIMLRLASDCGLRRAEVAQVHSDDLEQDLGGWSLVVHGKGRKVRIVPLPASLAADLLDLPEGYAFPGQVDGHLSAQWVGRLIRGLLDGYGMHSLRHRFATMSYMTDHDTFTLQQVLGHSSSETTRRYVQLPPDAARRMVEEVSRRNGAA